MYVAITGTMGAGKSSVAKMIAKKGYPVYDHDAMVKKYYEKDQALYRYVTHRFGDKVFNENGIDFSKIASIVFSNPEELSALEAKAFDLVKLETIEIMKANPQTLLFFEVPLLFEADLEELFDYVLVVDAEKELRLKRLAQKGVEKKDAKKRMKRQKPSDYKRKRADYIIENNADLESLEEEVSIFLQTLLLERGTQWIKADTN